MNSTRADANRTHAVLPPSIALASAAQAGTEAASNMAGAAVNRKTRRRRAAVTLWCIIPPVSAGGLVPRFYLLNFRASSVASQCAIATVAHERSNRSQVPQRLRSAVCNTVEQALEDIGGGGAVDDRAAPLARKVGFDHSAFDRRGRQPLIPKGQRQVDNGKQVARELTDTLDARRRLAVETEGQTDDDAADAM